MAIDPVCHMEVDEATAQWTSEYKGQTYYFCAPGCKHSFDKDPEKYLGNGEVHEHHGHEHHGHEHHEHEHHEHSDHEHSDHEHSDHEHSDHEHSDHEHHH